MTYDNDENNDIFAISKPSAIERMTPGYKAKKRKGKSKPKRKIGSNSINRSARSMGRKRRKRVIVDDVLELSAANAPEPTDKAHKSLWKCHSVEEVERHFDLWGGKFNTKALRATARRKLSPEKSQILDALLNQAGATSTPVLTSALMCKEAFRFLHTSLVALTQADPEMEVGMVTFICGDGATSHLQTEIELLHSQQKVQSTLRAMSKDFFGITELALFNNQRHPSGGQLVQRHEHALIFGQNVLKPAAVIAEKHAARFKPNSSGARIIDVKEVKTDEVNLARISSYLFKPPYRCKNWNPGKDGKPGHMNHSEKSDRFIRYLRLAQLRSMMSIEQVTFGGGEGHRIRSDLIKFLRALAAKEAAGLKRVLHPDAIPSFWVDLAKEIKAERWNLPIIKTRK